MHHTWVTKIEGLMRLAKEMKEDRDQCLILEFRTTTTEQERDLFISLIPDSVPPLCREIVEHFFNNLYAKETISKSGKVIRSTEGL